MPSFLQKFTIHIVCEPALKRWKQTSEEERRDHMQAANSARTSEQRAAATRAAAAKYTPEERSTRAKVACETLTPEQRRHRSLKGNATLTSEQRKARAERGVEKRADGYEQRRTLIIEISDRCKRLSIELTSAIQTRDNLTPHQKTLVDAATSALASTSEAASSVRSSRKAYYLDAVSRKAVDDALLSLRDLGGAAASSSTTG